MSGFQFVAIENNSRMILTHGNPDRIRPFTISRKAPKETRTEKNRMNAHVAHEVLMRALPRLPRGPLPENHALASALVTPLDRIPAATRARLLPILHPYLGG